MATLHFICGKAASGKTTLARKLAAEHRAVVFIEDEWVTLLEVKRSIFDVADYARHTRRLRAVLAPLAIQLLKAGTPVVFDFAGNTPKDRAWVRSIFEAAGADHLLHVISATDEGCKARLRQRNETKPEGLYYGEVTEAVFDEVTRYFKPPAVEENFRMTHRDAERT
jgi:predicted kinase